MSCYKNIIQQSGSQKNQIFDKSQILQKTRLQTQQNPINNPQIRQQGLWEIFILEAIQKKRAITISKQFANILLSQTSFFRYKIFQSLKYDVIKDQSTSSNVCNESYLKKQCNILFQNLPVFSPFSSAIIFIDFLVFWYHLVQLILLPLRFAFYDDENLFQSENPILKEVKIFGYFSMHLLDIVQAILQIIKIVNSMNTAIYLEGVFTLNRTQIMKIYFLGQLWIDLACLFGLFIQIKKFSTLLQLIKLSSLIFMVAHYSACLFLIVSNIDNDQQHTWLVSAEIQTKSWGIQYLYALYFMIITMSTIGYGDISPITVYEKIYGIMITLVACGVFAFAVNMIGTIFQEKEQQEAEYNQKKYIAQQFMETRNIQHKTQMKVLKYLEYQFKQEQKGGNILKAQEVLQKIPKNIREEVYLDFYSNLLINSKIIGKTFTKEFLEQLSLRMKELQLSPDEVLYKSGQIQEDSDNIYYINKGSLNIQKELPCYNEDIQYCYSIPQGSFLGEHEFFTGQVIRNDSVYSKGISHLIYFTKADFIELALQYPQQYEKYIILQEQINQLCPTFEPNRSVKCQYCLSYYHEPLYCSVVHFQINNIKTIQKFQNKMKVEQGRNTQFKRKKILKYNFKILIKKIQNQLIAKRKQIILENVKYVNVQDIFNNIQEDDYESFLTLIPSIRFKNDGDWFIETFEQYLQDLEDLEKNEQEYLKGKTKCNTDSELTSDYSELTPIPSDDQTDSDSDSSSSSNNNSIQSSQQSKCSILQKSNTEQIKEEQSKKSIQSIISIQEKRQSKKSLSNINNQQSSVQKNKQSLNNLKIITNINNQQDQQKLSESQINQNNQKPEKKSTKEINLIEKINQQTESKKRQSKSRKSKKQSLGQFNKQLVNVSKRKSVSRQNILKSMLMLKSVKNGNHNSISMDNNKNTRDEISSEHNSIQDIKFKKNSQINISKQSLECIEENQTDFLLNSQNNTIISEEQKVNRRNQLKKTVILGKFNSMSSDDMPNNEKQIPQKSCFKQQLNIQTSSNSIVYSDEQSFSQEDLDTEGQPVFTSNKKGNRRKGNQVQKSMLLRLQSSLYSKNDNFNTIDIDQMEEFQIYKSMFNYSKVISKLNLYTKKALIKLKNEILDRKNNALPSQMQMLTPNIVHMQKQNVYNMVQRQSIQQQKFGFGGSGIQHNHH